MLILRNTNGGGANTGQLMENTDYLTDPHPYPPALKLERQTQP